MFIHIELRKDIELDEAKRVAFAIINALDDAEAVPDQITEMSIGGYPEIWISDAADDIAPFDARMAQRAKETREIDHAIGRKRGIVV